MKTPARVYRFAEKLPDGFHALFIPKEPTDEIVLIGSAASIEDLSNLVWESVYVTNEVFGVEAGRVFRCEPIPSYRPRVAGSEPSRTTDTTGHIKVTNPRARHLR